MNRIEQSVKSLFCLYFEVCQTKTALGSRRERSGATHTSIEKSFVFRVAIHHDWYGCLSFSIIRFSAWKQYA